MAHETAATGGIRSARCAIEDLPGAGGPARQGRHRRHHRGHRLRRRTCPGAGSIVDYARRRGAGGKSRVFAPGGARVQAPMAAFANGALAHAFEMDNLTWPNTGVHPGATMCDAGAGGGAGARHRRPRADRGGGRGLRGDDPHRARDQAQQRGPRLPCAGHHRAVRRRGRGRPAVEVRRRDDDATRSASPARSPAGCWSSRAPAPARWSSGCISAAPPKAACWRRASPKQGFTGPQSVLEGPFGFLNVYCGEQRRRAR